MSTSDYKVACCKICRFRQGDLCRRHAPAPSANHTMARWPIIKESDFCGEYREG
jgi:hypothetical protein